MDPPLKNHKKGERARESERHLFRLDKASKGVLLLPPVNNLSRFLFKGIDMQI